MYGLHGTTWNQGARWASGTGCQVKKQVLTLRLQYIVLTCKFSPGGVLIVSLG